MYYIKQKPTDLGVLSQRPGRFAIYNIVVIQLFVNLASFNSFYF